MSLPCLYLMRICCTWRRIGAQDLYCVLHIVCHMLIGEALNAVQQLSSPPHLCNADEDDEDGRRAAVGTLQVCVAGVCGKHPFGDGSLEPLTTSQLPVSIGLVSSRRPGPPIPVQGQRVLLFNVNVLHHFPGTRRKLDSVGLHYRDVIRTTQKEQGNNGRMEHGNLHWKRVGVVSTNPNKETDKYYPFYTNTLFQGRLSSNMVCLHFL